MTGNGNLKLERYRAHVPEADLTDLRDRLSRVRWPESSTAPGWTQGIPLQVMRELCTYWLDVYDWRRTEARLNAVPQYMVDIDGQRVHVLHVRSPHLGAFPLILTHGWPGSIIEMLDLVAPLTDPTSHGGSAVDAFDVIIPSLPGYGFSSKPSSAGWGIERIARAWASLMAGLGYDRYGAAGSDWGTSISSTLGAIDSERVAGIHLVPPLAGPDPAALNDLTAAEQDALTRLDHRARTGSAYSEVHRTAPQTLGYALVDSPIGLCAWIAEKMMTWTDSSTTTRSDPSAAPTDHAASGLRWDQVLDQVTLYWFTKTAASSARLYAESISQVSSWVDGAVDPVVRVPVGASIFPAEVPRPSRRWATRRYPNIHFWAEHSHGGHFPALETPDLLVDDLRASFRLLR